MEPIFSSRVLDIIISEIEYMYSVVFAEGDRHKAMASLRVPDSSSTVSLQRAYIVAIVLL